MARQQKITTILVGAEVEVMISILDLSQEQSRVYAEKVAAIKAEHPGDDTARNKKLRDARPTYKGTIVNVYLVGGSITPWYTVMDEYGHTYEVAGGMVRVMKLASDMGVR